MKKSLVAALFLALTGCSKKGDNGTPAPDSPAQITSVSGSVSMADSIKSHKVVVAFYPNTTIYVFRNDTISGVNGNVGTSIAAITLVGGTTPRTFQINFPTNRSSIFWLVAWVDKNDNGQPDFATEPVRLPTRIVSNQSYAVGSWAWGVNGSSDDYTVALYIGTIPITNAFLRDIGGTGFSFTF